MPLPPPQRQEGSDGEEDTYDRQAGAAAARRRPQALSDGSASSGSDEDDWMSDDGEEDLFPDVTTPTVDDVVVLRIGKEREYTPRFPDATPAFIKHCPIFNAPRALRLGIVVSDDDYPELDVHANDEDPYVPVAWYVLDPRVGSFPHRRTEFVPVSLLDVLSRPFTSEEQVVANGVTGVLSDVRARALLAPIVFPKEVRASVPAPLAAQMHFSEYTEGSCLEHPTPSTDTTTNDVRSDGGGEGEGLALAPPSTTTSRQQQTRRSRRLARKKHPTSAPPKPPAATFRPRPKQTMTWTTYLADLPAAAPGRLLHMNAFRREACVVHRDSSLVGVVHRTDVAWVVAFNDCPGVLALVSDVSCANVAAVDWEDRDLLTHASGWTPGQRVRFGRHAVDAHLAFLTENSFTDVVRPNADTADAVLLFEVPMGVHCIFTTDHGRTWEEEPTRCHPSELVVLDPYYGEFIGPFSNGIHVTPALHQRLHDHMVHRAKSSEAAEETIDTLQEHLEQRHRAAVEADTFYQTERAGAPLDAVEAEAAEVTEQRTYWFPAPEGVRPPPAEAVDDDISALHPIGNLIEKLRLDEQEAEEEAHEGDDPSTTQKLLRRERLQKVLSSLNRCDPDDAPALRGSLSALEYAAFYDWIAPPSCVPPKKSDHPEDGGTEARRTWLVYVRDVVAPLVPLLVNVPFLDFSATVEWNHGFVERNVDSRCFLLREPDDNGDDARPPPQVGSLIGASAARTSLFPIEFAGATRSFGAEEVPRGLTEQVGEFDLLDLPEELYAAQAGDVVTMKIDDHVKADLEQFPDYLAELPRVVGMVLQNNHEDRTCVVHWSRAEPLPASINDIADPTCFPTTVAPPASNPLVAAASAVLPCLGRMRVGVVMRALGDGSSVVRWWDGATERLPNPVISVVQFPEPGEEPATSEANGDDPTDDEDAEVAEENRPEQQEERTAGIHPPNGTEAAESTPAGGVGTVSASLSLIRQVAANVAERLNDLGSLHSTRHDAADAAADAVAGDATTATMEDDATTQSVMPEGVFQCAQRFAAHAFNEPFSPAAPTRFYKRVQSEWRTLQREVPSGVSVKVSEEAMHLLKVMIRGPIHTPYYQGIFFFDIQLPPEYPTKPPLVKHMAHGLRMNPNLYDTGYVCLSLLGTWQGQQECEEWNPVTSNVLQLILALQAMVLTKEPHYNEPGYEDTRGTDRGRKASRSANEGYYLLKLEHLCRTARNPPVDWRTEVQTHVREYRGRILSRAARYLEQEATAQRPASEGEGAINVDGLVLPVTAGFQMSLRPRVEVLERALEACVSADPDGASE